MRRDVWIYVRSPIGLEHGESVKDQVKRCRVALIERGVDTIHVGILEEPPITTPKGGDFRELRRLLYDAPFMSEPKVLCVPELAWLSVHYPPQAFDVADTLDRLHQAHVRVISAKEDWDSSKGPAPVQKAALTWSSLPRVLQASSKGPSHRGGRPPIPEAVRDRAVELRYDEGWSWGEIALELHIGRTTVRDVCENSRHGAAGAERRP